MDKNDTLLVSSQNSSQPSSFGVEGLFSGEECQLANVKEVEVQAGMLQSQESPQFRQGVSVDTASKSYLGEAFLGAKDRHLTSCWLRVGKTRLFHGEEPSGIHEGRRSA